MCANVFLKLHVHYGGVIKYTSIIELPDRRCTHTRTTSREVSARFNFERVTLARSLAYTPLVRTVAASETGARVFAPTFDR